MADGLQKKQLDFGGNMDHVTTLALGLVYGYGWVGNRSHSMSLFCGMMVTYDYDFNFALG